MGESGAASQSQAEGLCYAALSITWHGLQSVQDFRHGLFSNVRLRLILRQPKDTLQVSCGVEHPNDLNGLRFIPIDDQV